MSISDKPSGPTPQSPPDGSVDNLAKEIEQTRAGMSATINQLEHRLSPAELGDRARVEIDHVEARVKVVVKESLHEAQGIVKEVLDEKLKAAKELLHEEIQEAKGAVKEQLHETKDLVKQGLSEARDTLKKDIQSAITHTKESMREATLGRVEDRPYSIIVKK